MNLVLRLNKHQREGDHIDLNHIPNSLQVLIELAFAVIVE